MQSTAHSNSTARPQLPKIFLSWAQSMNGALCLERGKSFPISGKESLIKTHQLRSQYDGILIGVDTFISDNPSLNVRYIKGNNPQPIIFDSNAKSSQYLDYKLFTRQDVVRPIICTLLPPDHQNCISLKACGCRILHCKKKADSPHLDIVHCLGILFSQFQITSIMVEGGARILTSFLQLADVPIRVGITISPLFLDGYNIIQESVERSFDIELTERLGKDIYIEGDILCAE